jgi:CBS domain-containing protein
MTNHSNPESVQVTGHLPLLVRDVMTSDPVTVAPTATVKDIAHAMLGRDVRSVPVVDVGDVLVGVVSEADLISREGFPTARSHRLAELIDDALIEHQHHWAARAEGVTAGELMTTDLVTCTPDEPVSVVTRRMLRHDVRTLPVVDHGRLVGVLSRHDVLRLFDRPDAEVRERIAKMLADPLWAPEDHHVEATVRDGVVVLSGTVQFASDVRVVAALVRHVPGVIEVVNRVSAAQADPKPAYLNSRDWR